MNQNAGGLNGEPATQSRTFRLFPDWLNLVILLLGLIALCGKLAEDRRLGVAASEEGATTDEAPCGVTAVTNTATASPITTSTSAAPSPTRTRARRSDGVGTALIPEG